MSARIVNSMIAWTLSLLLSFVVDPAPPPVSRVAPDPTHIRGSVVDDAGEPMPYVNVFLVGTTEGGATDHDGRFGFNTRRTGRAELEASMVGYEPARRRLHLVAGDTAAVHLVLREKLIELGADVVVEASAYSTGEDDRVALSSLEVVTTPGANADILLGMKAFPGVASMDEGAGLFVRGGDKSETLILLDGATLAHPYKYESPTGGVFGIIPPFLVRGTVFSTGGFSARYGNALSGVLAMESLGMPQEREVVAGVGLAAASIGVHLPAVRDKLGIRLTGNRSFTGLLFRVNDRLDDFTLTPRGSDVNASVTYRYRPSGRIKLFHFRTSERLGARVTEPSFEGVYRGDSDTRLFNLHWKDLIGPWLIIGTASRSVHDSRRRLGGLDLRTSDTIRKVRFDAERSLSERLVLAAGAEAEHTTSEFRGRVPSLGSVFHPDAEAGELDERTGAMRRAGYAELQWKAARRIHTRIGLRADAYRGEIASDPRLSFRFAISKHTDVRLAWGRFHQFADPYLYAAHNGNPDLGPQHARHLIAGIHHEKDLLLLRLEAYAKRYADLVILEKADRYDESRYVNAGDGYARGVDAFAKYGAFLRTRLSGWIAYSLLDARRLQSRHLGPALRQDTGPAPFDVTHTLNLVGKLRLVGFLYGGISYRYATGRPITPVISADPQMDGAYFLPVEGAIGGDRLPSFQRLDVQFSYYVPFGRNHNVVFFAAVNNVLDRAIVLGYDYSADYSRRTERTSYNRRFYYVGATLTIH